MCNVDDPFIVQTGKMIAEDISRLEQWGEMGSSGKIGAYVSKPLNHIDFDTFCYLIKYTR